MVFLVLVPSPSYVAIPRRELLPRGFTLTFSGGLFSVTACIRLLPSVLSTAGCSVQSGLSSESSPQRKLLLPPSRLSSTAPRGIRSSLCSDRRPIVLTSFKKDTDPVATADAVLTLKSPCSLKQRQVVLPICLICSRACARACRFVC